VVTTVYDKYKVVQKRENTKQYIVPNWSIYITIIIISIGDLANKPSWNQHNENHYNEIHNNEIHNVHHTDKHNKPGAKHDYIGTMI